MNKDTLVGIVSRLALVAYGESEVNYELMSIAGLTEALLALVTTLEEEDAEVNSLICELQEELAKQKQLLEKPKQVIETRKAPFENFISRMGVKAQSPLWRHIIINQEADRFVVFFPLEFYKENQGICGDFLNRLRERAFVKFYDATFQQNGTLAIICRRGSLPAAKRVEKL